MAFTNSAWWTWLVWGAVVSFVLVGYARARAGSLSSTLEDRWIRVGALGVGLVATLHMWLWDISVVWRLVLVMGFISALVLSLIAMRSSRPAGVSAAAPSGARETPRPF